MISHQQSAPVVAQRRAPRGLAIHPVALKIEGEEHIGVLRDISQAGMFFYSKAAPVVGSEIRAVIQPSAFDPHLIVSCKCRVVRTEQQDGAATGVGAVIESYEGA